MYTRRLTAADINNAVTAETVNELADLSGVFDPTRLGTVFSGSAASVDVVDSGLYLVKVLSDDPELALPISSALVLVSSGADGTQGQVSEFGADSVLFVTGSLVEASAGYKIGIVRRVG